MDERKINKRVSMSFKKGELSAKHIRLFNTIASAHADEFSRGKFMEKAIELLAKDVLGDDRIYENTIKSLEGFFEYKARKDDLRP